MRGLSLIAALVLAVGCAPTVPSGYSAAEGDVVFQSLPRSPLVDAIEGATKCPLSHCGIVVERGEELYVLEAFGSVRETPLPDWILRGRDQAFMACRLIEGARSMASPMVDAARRMAGQPYDYHYAFDNGAIYCSELVYLAFKEASGRPIGSTTLLRNLNWKPFEGFISELESGEVPLDREMITPRGLIEAPELRVVFNQGFDGLVPAVK